MESNTLSREARNDSCIVFHGDRPTGFSGDDCPDLGQFRDARNGLGMHRNEVIKYVEELKVEGLLEKRSSGRKLFYRGKHQTKEIES